MFNEKSEFFIYFIHSYKKLDFVSFEYNLLLTMQNIRSLRPHVSVDSVNCSSLSKQKITLITATKKKKLSSAVSYKNEFKKALLCRY
jgi:hypothetical protein